LHLGLIVPEPRDQLAIRVGSEVCHWEEGKALSNTSQLMALAGNRSGFSKSTNSTTRHL
jgi:aspartyl/asparaginyl beta-hydroxylase (cupin superfamily)